MNPCRDFPFRSGAAYPSRSSEPPLRRPLETRAPTNSTPGEESTPAARQIAGGDVRPVHADRAGTIAASEGSILAPETVAPARGTHTRARRPKKGLASAPGKAHGPPRLFARPVISFRCKWDFFVESFFRRAHYLLLLRSAWPYTPSVPFGDGVNGDRSKRIDRRALMAEIDRESPKRAASDGRPISCTTADAAGKKGAIALAGALLFLPILNSAPAMSRATEWTGSGGFNWATNQ